MGSCLIGSDVPGNAAHGDATEVADGWLACLWSDSSDVSEGCVLGEAVASMARCDG